MRMEGLEALLIGEAQGAVYDDEPHRRPRRRRPQKSAVPPQGGRIVV